MSAAQIGLEARVAALTQRVHAARRMRAAPAQEAVARAIAVGTLSVAFGGSHGARIDTITSAAADPLIRQPERRYELPAVIFRANSIAAVWEALAEGASVVRVDAPSGSGATTLLHVLAAEAGDHGFANGAFLTTDLHGPADDVAQRLAALLNPDQTPKYYTATDFERLASGPRSLILLDHAMLADADVSKLRKWFPTFCFIVVQTLALAQAPAIVLDPLDASNVITLLEASYGRPVDIDNRGPALDLCATLGSLPALTRLIGDAARELQRSFISLHVQFGTGDRIIRHFVASLPDLEQRILGIMAMIRTPLTDYHIAYIVRSSEVHAHLRHLVACDFVRISGAGLYEVPASVAAVVPPWSETDAATTRIVDVLCDALDSWPAVPLIDSQVAGAERLFKDVSARSRSVDVVALGTRLAQMYAVRGAFGAWGRLLGSVESAAALLGDTAALSLARHDLGVRAVLLGDSGNAVRFLTTAARDRQAAGDVDGAAASATVLDLADGLTASSARPAPAPVPELRAEPPSNDARDTQQSTSVSAFKERAAGASLRPAWALMLLGLGIVAAATIAFVFPHRQSASPRITQFASTAVWMNGHRVTELCVDASDIAVVEIFPDVAQRLGAGKHCLIVHPATTTTYVAVATAFDGQQFRRAVTVSGADMRDSERPRIAAFSVYPQRIAIGGSTRLCYAVAGAHHVRIVPRVGKLTRLSACRTIILHAAHHYQYTLTATGEDGQIAVGHVHVEVVASSSRVSATPRYGHNERLPHGTIYQFDATPSVVARGEATSLCVGVERGARGFVTHIGRLQPGITRCYRVQPHATTVYRLYVALQHAVAIATITVGVRPAASRREVAAITRAPLQRMKAVRLPTTRH